MEKWRTSATLILALFIVWQFSACSDNNSNDSSPLVGGSSSCSTDTQITLVQEPQCPPNQTVCGLKKDGIYKFLGIPYAASPERENRWRDPQPPQWTSIGAVEYGNRCPQGTGIDGLPADMCEDCLFLNVWTPKLTPEGTGDLPVMVFIHGGTFLSGSGGHRSEPLNLYDGTKFVETSLEDGGNGIVFVTLNYRLGALGFMASKELGIDGNFGIKDQQKALEWVHRNIALFGGNPNEVMIFGESAGAQSVAIHLTIDTPTPFPDLTSQDYFKRAIMESNYAITYMEIKEASKRADVFVELEGCDKATDKLVCMREKSVRDILAHQQNEKDYCKMAFPVMKCAGLQAFLPWNPVIDGTFITQNSINAPINKPVMLGSNFSEATPIVGIVSEEEAALVLSSLLLFLFGDDRADEIAEIYDKDYPDLPYSQKLAQVITDYLWTCFNRKFATIPTANAFRYHFIHHGSFPFWVDEETGEPDCPICVPCDEEAAVCHATELPFVFGNPTNTARFQKSFTIEEAEMSAAIRKYWVQFARGGDPNVGNQTHWPVDKAPRSLLEIDDTADGRNGIREISDEILQEKAHCEDLWDKIGYEVRSSFNCTADDYEGTVDIPFIIYEILDKIMHMGPNNVRFCDKKRGT
jgi:para-nitrobenzyl esterase